jgi:hypothetical protein
MISDAIAQAYSQEGGDLPFFVGKQYGSGWLRTLARIAFPIVKRAVRVAGRTADDVINTNKDWKTSLQDNTLEEVGNAVNTTINRVGNRLANKRKSNGSRLPPLLKKRRVHR